MRLLLSLAALGSLLFASAQAVALQSTLAQAHEALQAGEADRALSILDAMPASAETQNLRCRVQLTLQQWTAAVSACQSAVQMDGSKSLYHLWLGRALGEVADRASFLSAYSLGKRVRDEFQNAVRLDPHSVEALTDLGEFDYEAPAIVGGGQSKAYEIANQLEKIAPARAHELRGRIAEKNKDYSTAEREFKQAVALDPHPAFQWTVLASFYRRRNRWGDFDTAINNVLQLAQRDRQAAMALYDGASNLIAAQRNPKLAIRLLQDYLASPSKSEQAPAFAAFTQLARLHAQLGDRTEALQDREQALKLAHTYRPAQELKL
jgi:tetratricopeptide (TPR) repeat protein